jgi:hypothetical protein
VDRRHGAAPDTRPRTRLSREDGDAPRSTGRTSSTCSLNRIVAQSVFVGVPIDTEVPCSRFTGACWPG